MSARILQMPAVRRAAARSEADSTALARNAERLHFWRGASGRSYVHTVYSLIECPPMPRANYVLVKRGSNGRAIALRCGQVRHAAPTLNLAELRQLGAQLGASEVHVHLLASCSEDARLIELDVAAAECAVGNADFAEPARRPARAG
jgi:hypothetical protein